MLCARVGVGVGVTRCRGEGVVSHSAARGVHNIIICVAGHVRKSTSLRDCGECWQSAALPGVRVRPTQSAVVVSMQENLLSLRTEGGAVPATADSSSMEAAAAPGAFSSARMIKTIESGLPDVWGQDPHLGLCSAHSFLNAVGESWLTLSLRSEHLRAAC